MTRPDCRSSRLAFALRHEFVTRVMSIALSYIAPTDFGARDGIDTPACARQIVVGRQRACLVAGYVARHSASHQFFTMFS
jgi:hypothetical protein